MFIVQVGYSFFYEEVKLLNFHYRDTPTKIKVKVVYLASELPEMKDSLNVSGLKRYYVLCSINF